MNEFYKPLAKAFAAAEIEAKAKQIEQCAGYAALLAEKNKVMNLTGITDPQGVAVKHFCDSLMLPKFCALFSGASIIDIGTGAGFPGLPLAIFHPELAVTLLDSLEKRCSFLEEVAEALSLTNVTVIWGRAEDAARSASLRESFDFATARAVASLPVLIEYALPFLKVGGSFLPLKGKAEERDFDHALVELGAVLTEEKIYTLPIAEEERRIYRITKSEATKEKYPRRAGKVTKRPL